MTEVLQWAISAQAVTMLWLMGDANKWGPVVGMLGQILWIWYVIQTDHWGLAPGIAMFTAVHARNCWRMWKRASKHQVKQRRIDCVEAVEVEIEEAKRDE